MSYPGTPQGGGSPWQRPDGPSWAQPDPQQSWVQPDAQPWAQPGPQSYQQWYGEAPSLDGAGAPEPPSRKWRVIALTALSVVVLVATGALLWGLGGTDSETTGAVASTTGAVASTTGAGVSSTPQATTSEPLFPSTSVSVPPRGSNACLGKAAPNTPTGWQTVEAKRGLSYDVPGNWEVSSCGTLIGWEKKCPDGPFGYCPIRTMSGAASLDNPKCAKSSLAVSGVPGSSDISDINQSVNAEATKVADIYTSEDGQLPAVSLSSPKSLTVSGRPAVQVIATVTGIKADACTGPSALHSMVATTVPGQDGTVLFVISLEQGIDGAPDAGVIDRMVASLRTT